METTDLSNRNRSSLAKILTSFNTKTIPSNDTSIAKNFVLVWLDPNIDETNPDCRNTIEKLRCIVDTIRTFTDWPKGLEYIIEMKKVKVFMIVSGTLGQHILPDAQRISQIEAIYVFCANKLWHEQWAMKWSKVKGVFTEIDSICTSLTQATRPYDQDPIAISLMPTSVDIQHKNLDQLEHSFMYTQLLKEILIDFDYNENSLKDLTDYCRNIYADNSHELHMIDEFEQKYFQGTAILWYTYECFLYKMLNRALRDLEIDIIILMGFFIRDLYRQIQQLHAIQYGSRGTSSFVVYRGQCMSNAYFDKVQKNIGGLISFNDFLSTSKVYTVSMEFDRKALNNPDSVGVIFLMKIDPSIATVHFADVEHISHTEHENEVLFSMHAIFRIERIGCLEGNKKLCEVHLRLTRDNDEKLNKLTQCIRDESDGLTASHRLGALLIKLGQFDQARKIFTTLLNKTSNEKNKGLLYHQLGRIENCCGKYKEALFFYDKSFTIYQQESSQIHSDLGTLYNDFGLVYTNMKDYSKALSFYEKSLQIYKKILPPNHPNLATTYNNIGLIHDYRGNDLQARQFYEKSLQIYQKTLPENHPNVAALQVNLGTVYYHMGDYSKARQFFQKSLEIKQEIQPKSHPSFATLYNNLGLVHENMNEHSKALEFYEKSLNIDHKVLPPDHPNLASSYKHMGVIHEKMTDYAKALPFYEKSLEIYQKTLPINDQRVLTLHGSIGSVYEHLGEYSKALSFYKKKHEVLTNTVTLSQQVDKIKVHSHKKTGECTDGLLLDSTVCESSRLNQVPPPPDLATSFNDMGSLYYRIEEYSAAYKFFERAVSIGKSTLPSSDPKLQMWMKNLEKVRKKL
jgi:tetratricopeptide (TPR) repeat protein